MQLKVTAHDHGVVGASTSRTSAAGIPRWRSVARARSRTSRKAPGSTASPLASSARRACEDPWARPDPEVSGCDDYLATVSEGVRGGIQHAIGRHLDGGRFGHLNEHGRIAVDDLGDLTAEKLGTYIVPSSETARSTAPENPVATSSTEPDRVTRNTEPVPGASGKPGSNDT
jgi:hypothetical protein